MFGRPICTRLDLLHPSITHDIEERQEDQREAAGGRPRQFQVGQAVWARTYAGPRRWRRGEVIGVIGPVSYQADVGEAVWAPHADQLLSAPGRDEQQPTDHSPQQQQQRRPTDSAHASWQPALGGSFSWGERGGGGRAIRVRGDKAVRDSKREDQLRKHEPRQHRRGPGAKYRRSTDRSTATCKRVSTEYAANHATDGGNTGAAQVDPRFQTTAALQPNAVVFV